MIKKKFLLSSVTGIIINLYLFCSSYIGYMYYSKTDALVFILIINIVLYISSYQLLKSLSK